ncbi:hypothetical protein FZEAL_7874 [Fusarium zealandicum]|uniref:Kinesin-like protein n=1 Tax=Fusarium zealandicum TaxID=1053134 RepID=A0A8H4UF55_9HYPO|nr:hypothetical protein FZEAL_7874 [Fusarium zealandicum]
MEEYVLDNVERYLKLVQKFIPTAKSKSRSSTLEPEGRNPDMVVTARIRPLLKEEVAAGLPPAVFPRPAEPGVLDLHELRRPPRGLAQLRSVDFRVDHTFGSEASTEQVYNSVVKPLVSYAWNGGIGTLFAYGQTGSGKTYTVSRLAKLVAEELMSGEVVGSRTVNVTIIELVGNAAYDLLNARQPVPILEDTFGVIQLTSALEHCVSTAADMLNLIETATTLRRTETTDKNDTSSRSHSICRVRIQQNSLVDNDEDGVLYLIDLAGSEAARDTANHDSQRMRESRDINTSLSVLKDCIRGKAEADAAMSGVVTSSKRKPYVPFRQSPLTKILKHVFDPDTQRRCKTVVVACVNPCLLDAPPSRNTLRYAETLRVIVPKVVEMKYDAKIPRTWNNKQLKLWIRENSGSPPVDASLLAPLETGLQLLRLAQDEFQSRCLKTPGVDTQQAMAFRSKIWQMHIDSQRVQRLLPDPVAASGPDAGSGLTAMIGLSRSHDLDPEASSTPFKQRIRPGMAISWTPLADFPMALRGINVAVVLCPAAAAGPSARDILGRPVDAESDETGQDARYLCAMVAPGILAGAYELNVWRQVVIGAGQMNSEVLLEYDVGSRYYFLAV